MAEKAETRARIVDFRREQALGNAQVTEQQVAAEMHAFGNISEALALGTTAGLDYICE